MRALRRRRMKCDYNDDSGGGDIFFVFLMMMGMLG